VVPELLQNRMTSDNIAQEALAILGDSTRQRVMKESFQALQKTLGGPGASKRAAEMIVSEIRT